VENGFWELVIAQSIEPAYEPADVVVVVHDDQWVGFSITDSYGEGYVLSDSVWVVPAHRVPFQRYSVTPRRRPHGKCGIEGAGVWGAGSLVTAEREGRRMPTGS
jgi:hypothetical protein